MKLSGLKKIILLGIILLIIAGIVIVALKGINVSLILQQHESINLLIGKPVEIKDVQNICNEVFANKRVIVRKLELFGDSVNIISESITDEANLITKINEKYETDFTVDDVNIEKNSNIRVRDLVRPYVLPVMLSFVLIVAYIIIRFRKINSLKLLGKICVTIILTEALIASCIAITRLPLLPIMINLMSVVAIFEVVLFISRSEKCLKNK